MTVANRPELTCGQRIVNGAFHVATCASAGAITAAIWGPFYPIAGAAFGATQALTGIVLEDTLRAVSPRSPVISTSLKIALFIPMFIASTIAGLYVTAAIGVPVSLMTGVLFTFAMIVGHLATAAIKFGLRGCTNCVGGTLLAIADRRA